MSTRTRFSNFLGLLLGAASLAAAAPAAAEVTSVMGSTASRAVVGTPTVVTVDWRVTVAAPGNTSSSVISSFAFVTIDGDTADSTAVRVPHPLKRHLPPTGAPSTRTALFRETLTVPAELVDAALAAGRRVVIVRSFRDQENAAPVRGSVVVPFGGSNTARLNIARIALHFPDGAQDKIMAPNARSHVLADIAYTGTGRFSAVWEIAEPTSTLAEPMFRTLFAVHRNLVGGLQSLTLRSPNLPSGMDGLHLLRLRIVAPAGFGAPVIQYYVNGALQPRPAPMRVLAYAPGEGARYGAGTSFRWSPVKGAVVYQLEFFARGAADIADQLPELGSVVAQDPSREEPDAEERYPITGVMVTGVSTQTSLSPLSLSHLAPGRTYQWRVAAYDADGQLLGASALRSLVIPETP